MKVAPRFRGVDWLFLLLSFAAAAGARAWYVTTYAERGDAKEVWHVQDQPPRLEGLAKEVVEKKGSTDVDILVANMKEEGIYGGFRSISPLGPSNEEEITAHIAPGYPLFRMAVENHVPGAATPQAKVRWIQALLGSLAAALYYLIARRAFGSSIVAALAGLFCAVNPFWVINTAELNDGTLTSFLLAAGLAFGQRSGQQGGALTSLLFGLLLAALALTRAALLPFAIVAVLWFCLRSRSLQLGWMYAFLAVIGLVTPLAVPFGVENIQKFKRPIPITDTAWLHLWVGNNPRANGGPLDPAWLKDGAVSPERLDELAKLKGPEQPQRYEKLGAEVIEEVKNSPGKTLQRRLVAGLSFLTGAAVIRDKGIMEARDLTPEQTPPPWVEGVLYTSLFVILLLGILGWRCSYSLRRTSMPLQLTIFWIPLPYILSHAELLHGPRLPLDGPLLCLGALALVCLVPGLGGSILRGSAFVEVAE